MKKLLACLLTIALFFLCACGTPLAPCVSSGGAETADGMTLEEKVGQLFIIRPDSLDASLTPEQVYSSGSAGVTALTEVMKETLEKYPAGGIAFFGKNIVSPDQLKAFTADLQNSASTGLFIAVDEEGGSVSRIAGATGFDEPQYESMEAVGKTGDPKCAEDVGVTIGTYLKKYGFNLDFAPVADVNTNPENTVIGSRAFGSEPGLAADMVSAEIDGLHSAGIMTCAKHFPGHGDTRGDTHSEFVSVEKDWAQLRQCELVPFEAAIRAGTDMVMVAHIQCESIDSSALPASLSSEMITNRLRGELGYKGVVITDGMAMAAITGKYSSGEAAVMAIKAGADIVLMPEDYTEAFSAVLEAVKSGEINEKRLDESVSRILELKAQYGLITTQQGG